MTDNAMVAAFADELAAHRYFERLLWPKGPVCPHCGAGGRIHKLDGASTRIGAHKCYACRRIFSITYGTIFEHSHVPLHKWLQAIYLTDGGNRPIRPFHLSKIISVSNKTAITMLLRLENASKRARSSLHRGPIAPSSASTSDSDMSVDC